MRGRLQDSLRGCLDTAGSLPAYSGSPQRIRPVADKAARPPYVVPTHLGFRFSLKAVIPSRASSDSRACM
jgi:hypothetical protein